MPTVPPRPAPARGLATACVQLAGVAVLAIQNSDGPPRTASFAGAVPLAAAATTPGRTSHAVTTRTARPTPRVRTTPPSAPAAAPAVPSTPETSAAPRSAAPAAPAVPAASPTTGPGLRLLGSGAVAGGDQSGKDSRIEYAHQVFQAINRARRAAHLPALAWSDRLRASAEAHDRAMALTNTLSHQVDSEPSLGDRESGVGVHWTWAAENIGWTTDDSLAGALDIEARMLAETAPNDAHRRTVLSPRAEALGVDVYYDAAHHRLWLTEDFAGLG